MDENERKNLVIRHAQLAAAFASGNRDVLIEMKAIEDKLQLNPVEIAKLAVEEYLRDY